MRHRDCKSPEPSYGDNGICSLTAHKPVVEERRYASGTVIVQNSLMGTMEFVIIIIIMSLF